MAKKQTNISYLKALRTFIKVNCYMRRNIPGRYIGYKKSENQYYVFFVLYFS